VNNILVLKLFCRQQNIFISDLHGYAVPGITVYSEDTPYNGLTNIMSANGKRPAPSRFFVSIFQYLLFFCHYQPLKRTIFHSGADRWQMGSGSRISYRC
jgi:hypothetical protein